jgi:hypothetical protein
MPLRSGRMVVTKYLAIIFILSACVIAGPIEDLQPGEWYEIPNTQLSSAAYDWSPNYPPGNSGVRSVIAAWSGAAIDTAENRMLIWGGGHQDYGGNEIYAFDFDTLQWSIVAQPSPFSVIESATGASYYSDGLPASIHTQNTLIYSSTFNALCHIGGGGMYPGADGENTFDCYDFDTDSWTKKTDAPIGDFVVTARNPDDDHVFLLGLGDDNCIIHEYDPALNSWTQRTAGSISAFSYNYYAMMVVAEDYLIAYGNGRYYKWDISDSSGNIRVLSTSSSGPQDAVADSHPTGDYDLVAGNIVSWIGGDDVYMLDIETDTWSRISGDGSQLPSRTTAGVYRRWSYIPGLNVFALYTGDDIENNMWIYRHSSGTPVPPFPPENLRILKIELHINDFWPIRSIVK